ncbi:FYN-binding protein 1-like isoform X6 [Haliotis rufescens]|uniref:FYN-binding protein 1-like isoform X6 n=1 Tax=Haliotis rufescens TaxID=6454 RepID=UPI001EB02F34|nr:FYN-binding protein 1-like isoform X6 [Haliotis rufescens]
MNWQRYNYKVRLRDDSSWKRQHAPCSRPTPPVLKSKGDVNDEEIYDDGTSITNIKVLGVKDKIAMFGPKPTVGSKPMSPALAKFHAMREESGQGGSNGGTPSWKKPAPPKSPEPSPANKAPPAWKKPTPTSVADKSEPSKTVTTPSWKKPTPTSVDKDKNEPSKPVTTPSWKKPTPTSSDKDKSEPSKTVTTPSWKKPTPTSDKADENKTAPHTTTPSWKRPPSGPEKTTPAWKKPTPTTGKDSQPETDQNQNVTNVPAWKRQSNKVNIPGKFGGTSPSPEVTIEEKPVNGTATKPTSPSSPTTKSSESDSGQKFDPKALLRRTSTGDTTPKQITFNHPRQRSPDVTSPFSPGNTPKSPSSNIPKHVTQSKTIVIRNGDGKKYEKLPKSSIITTDLKPIKPLKLLGSNVKDIIAEYIKAFDEYKNANEELYDDVGNYIQAPEEQEVYDDVANTIEHRSSNRKSKRPVSEIAAMTEEEEMREFGSAGSASASGGSASISGGSMAAPVTEEIYDDAEQDELYEPLPEDEELEISAQEDKKELERKAKEAAEKKKKEDKERKEREKKEKAEQAKLEKERKEKEKKEKELRKKFKLTGDEKKSAEGVVRSKAKGGKTELAVETGEILDIIRMTENPAGKWLVMNREGTYGYVESKNIDIEETAIKKAMIEYIIRIRPQDYYQYRETAMKVVDTPIAMEGEFGQEEMYEDLDEFQAESEEIYEECS